MATDAEPPTTMEGGRVVRVADTTLDAGIVLLATWTVAYHVALVLRMPSTLALLAEVLLLGAAGVFVVCNRRQHSGRCDGPAARRRSSPPGPARTHVLTGRPTRTALGVATVVTTAVAAVAMALSAPWVVVWVCWLVAAGAGTTLAFLRLRVWPVKDAAGKRPNDPDRAGQGWVLAMVWAFALAAFSTLVLRTNPDDLFYVNISQWVAAHGTFPLRDTLFADLTYPMANWPPVASYDGLVGALAHVAGVRAGDVVYVVVPPVATFLSVLALWRLLRAWRVSHVGLALTVALGFLLADGTSSYGSPGNLFVTRLWQGKVILLCLVVPLLLVYALRYVERPTLTRAGWLFLGGIAAVGLSTTAMFLVPLVALAGAAPLVRTGPRRALIGAVSMAAYPATAGVVTLALGGRSADDFGARRLYRFDPAWFGHEVFLTGMVAMVGVASVLLGVLLVPHPAARVTTGLMALFVGITFVPGFTHLSYDVIGIGPTLWRVTWGCAVGASVGVAVARLYEALPDRLSASRVTQRAGPAVLAIAVVLVLIGLGHPVWAADTTTRLAAPPHWQRGSATRSVVTWMERRSTPGAVVLVPQGLGVTVATTTTTIKTVAPRTYAMAYLRNDPSFRYGERLVLQDLVNRVSEARPARVRVALRDLKVSVACVFTDYDAGARILTEAGYRQALRTPTYRCLTPGPPAS